MAVTADAATVGTPAPRNLLPPEQARLHAMRVAVAAWIGSTNLGDELVFASLRSALTRRGAEVVALSVAPAATEGEHGVRATRRAPGTVELLRGVDALVLGGGGLLQDE